MAVKQLPLSVTFREDAVFDDFLPGDNAQTVGALRHALARLDDHLLYLWGAPGSGLSHLLQAAVHELQTQGLEGVYLPLAECLDYGTEALEGLDELDVVALDDIDLITGRPEWEEAVFHLFNRLRDTGRVLMVTSHSSPLHQSIELPDLKSRLSWGLTFQVQPLSDEQKMDWLIWKARRRGLTLEPDVAAFLINRVARSMNVLVEAFDKLDQHSLAEKRRLTIPFVKSVLGL
ncbi:DnaA regulatory inactivator Hda [Saccharospirillum salsuginis]|uniref:DnaA regulatory inactivator Hda n=1 Tax=Saccharospirillum salsuginis TaxID=418750 RepID=A0A918KJD0_9GAMM|nr:DnaA regulatory inactivator Hda [Saccharospirillum salsuginis]GGX65372.1 DnaA regulatory inactivator Hda [Saccharospirillum salsuginis]